MAKQANTKRQEQARETKNRIYNSAIELMEKEGFDNITIADIREKAGVSVGAFYHYFASKNDFASGFPVSLSVYHLNLIFVLKKSLFIFSLRK